MPLSLSLPRTTEEVWFTGRIILYQHHDEPPSLKSRNFDELHMTKVHPFPRHSDRSMPGADSRARCLDLVPELLLREQVQMMGGHLGIGITQLPENEQTDGERSI